MRKGFTLVELAIVLVIVGLLIGGILVGKSMIETVNLQNFGRQISQYDIAVQNFKTKYNTLPGDSPGFTPAGNGDGEIRSSSSDADGYPDKSDYEIKGFWPQLSQSGMINDGNTYSSTWPGSVAGCNRQLPCLKSLKIQTTYPNYTSKDIGSVYPTIIPYSRYGKHFWQLGPFAYDYTSFIGGQFTARQVWTIEKKFDDGIYYDGKIRAVFQYYSSIYLPPSEGGTCPASYYCSGYITDMLNDPFFSVNIRIDMSAF